jgi:hypothetical protein
MPASAIWRQSLESGITPSITPKSSRPWWTTAEHIRTCGGCSPQIGFPASGCNAPESCSRLKLNNFCQCVCTETCIDNSIRIPTEFDLNPMYEFGVVTAVRDHNPSDGWRMRLKRTARPSDRCCRLFICRVAHHPGHSRSRTVFAVLRTTRRCRRIYATLALRPVVRKSAAAAFA